MQRSGVRSSSSPPQNSKDLEKLALLEIFFFARIAIVIKNKKKYLDGVLCIFFAALASIFFDMFVGTRKK